MNRLWWIIAAFAVFVALAFGSWRWVFPLPQAITLHQFSQDVVPILQLGLIFVGLVSVFLVWWQIRENRLWNKLKSTHNFLDVELAKRLEADVLEHTKPLGIVITDGVTSADLPNLKTAEKAGLAIKALLNDCENMCAAYQVGYIDRDLAYNVHSARVLRLFKLFAPFIEDIRQKHQDDAIYLELEKTALEWEAKDATVKAKHAAQISKLRAKLSKQKGLQQKA